MGEYGTAFGVRKHHADCPDHNGSVAATVIGSLGAIGMYRYNFHGKRRLTPFCTFRLSFGNRPRHLASDIIYEDEHSERLLSLILAHVTFCIRMSSSMSGPALMAT